MVSIFSENFQNWNSAIYWTSATSDDDTPYIILKILIKPLKMVSSVSALWITPNGTIFFLLHWLILSHMWGSWSDSPLPSVCSHKDLHIDADINPGIKEVVLLYLCSDELMNPKALYEVYTEFLAETWTIVWLLLSIAWMAIAKAFGTYYMYLLLYQGAVLSGTVITFHVLIPHT